ncbi:MAG: SIMPL domain-containing protein [Kofleriaceae bacterium]
MRTFLVAAVLAAGAAACRQPVTHVHLDRGEDDRPRPGQFVVDGTASLELRPDVADIHLTIGSESPRAKQAAAEVRTRQAALRQALVAAGIAADQLTFSGLRIAPAYDDKGRLRGYRAGLDLTATTTRFEDLPDLLELVVNAGATDVSTTARVRELSARKREVRDLALAAAKAKAEQTATALGVKLGRIVAIAEGGDRWGGYQTANVAQTRVGLAPRADDDAPLQADTQELRLTVSLTYEL